LKLQRRGCNKKQKTKIEGNHKKLVRVKFVVRVNKKGKKKKRKERKGRDSILVGLFMRFENLGTFGK
jgi:hypothetical protein